jgi:hypothetical protein
MLHFLRTTAAALIFEPTLMVWTTLFRHARNALARAADSVVPFWFDARVFSSWFTLAATSLLNPDLIFGAFFWSLVGTTTRARLCVESKKEINGN